jgi:hypothetical protein
MAVSASNNALRDRGLNALPRYQTTDHVADVFNLYSSHVVKLQHQRIRFAAIYARRSAENFQHALPVFQPFLPCIVAGGAASTAVRAYDNTRYCKCESTPCTASDTSPLRETVFENLLKAELGHTLCIASCEHTFAFGACLSLQAGKEKPAFFTTHSTLLATLTSARCMKCLGNGTTMWRGQPKPSTVKTAAGETRRIARDPAARRR